MYWRKRKNVLNIPLLARQQWPTSLIMAEHKSKRVANADPYSTHMIFC